jgi:hypothetical protein
VSAASSGGAAKETITDFERMFEQMIDETQDELVLTGLTAAGHRVGTDRLRQG